MYKVSKSLIEQYPNTMLARLVSDTWKKKKEEDGDSNDGAIFIDRDGETFCYVLNYMRDMKVHLVNTDKISSKAVLQELHHFGFEDVPRDAVQVGCTGLDVDAYRENMKKTRKRKLEEINQKKLDVDKMKRDLELLERYERFAYACFEASYKEGKLLYLAVQHKSDCYIREIDLIQLNKCLVSYDLCCTRWAPPKHQSEKYNY